MLLFRRIRDSESHTYTNNIDDSWLITPEIKSKISIKDSKFIELELSQGRTIENHNSHLTKIGFTNLEVVLDAGCGIGQWSISASYLNSTVKAIDVNKERIEFAKNVADNLDRKNIEFIVGSIENIPFEDESIDAIFCSGVIMFSKYKKTLREFDRILKKGGICYINFNSLGWILYAITQNYWNPLNWYLLLRGLFGFRYLGFMRKKDIENYLGGIGNYAFETSRFSLRFKSTNVTDRISIWNYPIKRFGFTTIWETIGKKSYHE